MNTEFLSAPFGWQAAAALFGASFASGFVPIVNIELVLLGVGIARGGQDVVGLTLAATLGQVISKAITYFAAQAGSAWLLRKQTRYQEKIRRWESWIHPHPVKQWLFLFISAFSGFPPYFVVSILAGTAGSGFLIFITSGLVGRALRFALIVLFADKLAPLLAR